MLVTLRPTQQTIDIVAGLGGKWHGSYAMCICPAHADSTPSLSIRQGERGILVHCFAGCDNEDVLRAIARTSPVTGSPTPKFLPAPAEAHIRWIWEQARPVAGTMGEAYLKIRGLPIDVPDVRFHPRCPFGRKPKTRLRPSLIVAVRSEQELTAIQRIVLRPRGDGHQGKFMLGSPGTGAWAPAFSGSQLAIAEGFEDAAGYTILHGVPCWSPLGDKRFPTLRIPDQVKQLIIAEDNDTPGRAAALAAVDAHSMPGREITRHAPPKGIKDWAMACEKADALAKGR